MSNRKTAVVAVIAVLVLLAAAGCVTKKTHLAQIAEKDAQIQQAQNSIAELKKSNEALDKGLTDTKKALEAAQAENGQLKQSVSSLKDQIAALESQKTELDAAVAAGKVSEANYKKKTSALNWQIGQLKKDMTEKEAKIAAKDAEIAKLQASETALKAAADEQSRKMAALNTEKDGLAAKLDQTISSKNTLIGILGVLLLLAVILAIVGFGKARKSRTAV